MNQSILFLLRRLGFYLMAAFAALTLNFFIPRLMPGDPATIIFARFRGKLKPEAIDALRETFGLNDASLIDQYFSYLKSILSGDLGISIAYFPQEVSSVISGALMWHHPKYYAALRKLRRKLTSSQASGDKHSNQKPRVQASSQSQQAQVFDDQGTSGQALYPGCKQQE